MYNDLSKIEPPNPTPTNPVNLVNPVQNPHSTARRHPRIKTEPSRPALANQRSRSNRKRIRSGSKANRTRIKSRKILPTHCKYAHSKTQKRKKGRTNRTNPLHAPSHQLDRQTFLPFFIKWKFVGHFLACHNII
jgi:hypothetical protein